MILQLKQLGKSFWIAGFLAIEVNKLYVRSSTFGVLYSISKKKDDEYDFDKTIDIKGDAITCW